MNKLVAFIGTIIFFMCSCRNGKDSFTPEQSSLVKDSVLVMTESIAKDVTHDGPVAWLRYFENSPDFFMVSGGQLVFSNFDSAKKFINDTLVGSISKIELRWSNIRIDPLTDKLASIAATFHEDITDATGNKMPVDGYFTCIAHQTSQGWKLRNAHWSMISAH